MGPSPPATFKICKRCGFHHMAQHFRGRLCNECYEVLAHPGIYAPTREDTEDFIMASRPPRPDRSTPRFVPRTDRPHYNRRGGREPKRRAA